MSGRDRLTNSVERIRRLDASVQGTVCHQASELRVQRALGLLAGVSEPLHQPEALQCDVPEYQLTRDQLIPLAEAEDLMIGISEKEQEEQVVEKDQAARYQLRTAFWHRMLEALDEAGVTVYGNVAPSKDHWLYAGSGLSGVQYTMILNRDEARVEFALSKGSREANKYLFDLLHAKAPEIEARFGEKLIWDRLNDKKSSRVRAGTVHHPARRS